MEPPDHAVRSNFNGAKLLGMAHLDGYRRHGHLGALLLVKFHHVADIHAVDVVRPEDAHHVRIRLLDEVDVLIDGIGGPAIPNLTVGAHLGGHGNDEMILQHPRRFPPVAEVLQQGLALELNQHVDGVDAGIQQIAQDEIDDPVLPPKGTAGLARSFVSGYSLVPLPPARTKASTRSCMVRSSCAMDRERADPPPVSPVVLR